MLALATATFSVNVFMPAVYVNLMVISAAMMALFSVSSSIVYARVPDELRGRVSGLYVLTWGMMPIGSLSIGFLAEHLGAPGRHRWPRRRCSALQSRGLANQGAKAACHSMTGA